MLRGSCEVAGHLVLRVRGFSVPIKMGVPAAARGDAWPGCAAQLWDLRAKRSVHTLQETYQVTAVAFAEAGDQVYTGGIENVIKVTPAWGIPCSLSVPSLHHTKRSTEKVAGDHGMARVATSSGCTLQRELPVHTRRRCTQWCRAHHNMGACVSPMPRTLTLRKLASRTMFLCAVWLCTQPATA